MTSHADKLQTPFIVLLYGLLGIIPFWLPVLTTFILPQWNGLAGSAQAAYAALILSFLGGARWGQETHRSSISAFVVSLSMIPTLAGLTMLFSPVKQPIELLLLAAALALQ